MSSKRSHSSKAKNSVELPEQRRQQIENQVAKFLANGGEIQSINTGISGDPRIVAAKAAVEQKSTS